MGLFDLPAPPFGFIDGVLAMAMPPLLRLVFWGILAGWFTMVLYRLFSDQEKIGALKVLQKNQQKNTAEFDGEFSELLPIIRHTLGLGFKQLGLALGPALLATIPVLFIVIWVAGEFGYVTAVEGSEVFISIEPASSDIHWLSTAQVRVSEGGWVINWPSQGQSLTMNEGTVGGAAATSGFAVGARYSDYLQEEMVESADGQSARLSPGRRMSFILTCTRPL